MYPEAPIMSVAISVYRLSYPNTNTINHIRDPKHIDWISRPNFQSQTKREVARLQNMSYHSVQYSQQNPLLLEARSHKWPLQLRHNNVHLRYQIMQGKEN